MTRWDRTSKKLKRDRHWHWHCRRGLASGFGLCSGLPCCRGSGVGAGVGGVLNYLGRLRCHATCGIRVSRTSRSKLMVMMMNDVLDGDVHRCHAGSLESLSNNHKLPATRAITSRRGDLNWRLQLRRPLWVVLCRRATPGAV